MQKLSDLDLFDLPMGTPEFAADPYSFVEQARAKHPWIAKCEAGYCVFEYKAMLDLLRMDDQMRPSFDGVVEIMGAKGSPWGRFTDEQMVALPEREHDLLRKTFSEKFTPRFANRMRPVMREIMTGLLDQWAPRQAIDFEEFVSYYPVSVISKLVGGPLDAIPSIRSSLETFGLGQSLDPSMLPELDKAYLVIEEFCQSLIDDRKAKPHADEDKDLLDILIEAGEEGGISDRQLTDLLIFLYVAGYDTSKNVMTYMMLVMSEHPEIYRRCAEDLDYCGECVEEMLRYFNPATSSRFTTHDVVYRDVLLPKDTMLFFPLSIAGRDPTKFDNPDAFDPERSTAGGKRHIAFGLGKHMCLGQYIARVQIQEGLHLIAQRMGEPCVTGEPGRRPFYGVWGLKGLPIEFRDLEAA